MARQKMKPELRTELTLAKIKQHEPVTDQELAEVGEPPPAEPGWWYDPRDFTWRWVSPALTAKLMDLLIEGALPIHRFRS